MKIKNEKGITLIALIITIVILIILAVVAIFAINNTDIIAYTTNASKDYKKEQAKENGILHEYSTILGGHTHLFSREDTGDKYYVRTSGCYVYYYYSCECGEKGEETFSYSNHCTHGYHYDEYGGQGHVGEAECCECGSSVYTDLEPHTLNSYGECTKCGYQLPS